MFRPLLLLLGLCAGLVGCDEEPVTAAPPLQPLIYTELPDITPEGAAVRERRLLRELEAGAAENWGQLKTSKLREPAQSLEELGKQVTDALLTYNGELWDQVFIQPRDYADLVHVEALQADKFADEIRGASEAVWEVFEPPRASEIAEHGFAEVFAFAGVTPGSARALDGRAIAEGEFAGQYWNSAIKLRFRADPSVVVELHVPKIVRTGSGLAIASKVQADRNLRVLVAAGLHLKTSLLRTEEYPFPLKVGNFWRYRRRYDLPTESVDSLPLMDGTERLLEVTSLDLLGPVRLVTLEDSLNDSALTHQTSRWLLTPRQIFSCNRQCRAQADDLNAVLEYFAHSKPLYEFPLRTDRDGVTGVANVEVPAGEFPNVVKLSRDGRTEMFGVRRGVVHRSYEHQGHRVVEELVDFRLVP